VVEILVAQGDAVDALGEELGGGMLDGVGVAVVGEASGELLEDGGALLDLGEEEGPAVGGEVSAGEGGVEGSPGMGLESQRGCVTVCVHGAVFSVWRKGSCAKPLCHRRRPRAIPTVRNPG